MSHILTYAGIAPRIAEGVYVAPTASVVGAVTVGAESSIWFGAVLRGDVQPITIGARSSIQDNTVIHGTGGWQPTALGDDVTVGHSAILHGCIVRDRVLVGMGAILMDAVEINSDTLIGAGSLITARTRIPSGVLVHGRPARVIRDLRDEEVAEIREASRIYVGLTAEYRGT